MPEIKKLVEIYNRKNILLSKIREYLKNNNFAEDHFLISDSDLCENNIQLHVKKDYIEFYRKKLSFNQHWYNGFLYSEIVITFYGEHFPISFNERIYTHNMYGISFEEDFDFSNLNEDIILDICQYIKDNIANSNISNCPSIIQEHLLFI